MFTEHCSEYPRVSKNVTKTCHKTAKRFRAYVGSERTPVQAYTNSDHTSVQSIYRFRDSVIQSIRPFRDEPIREKTSEHTSVQANTDIISDAKTLYSEKLS